MPGSRVPGITFYSFPHKDKILCRRWEIATKLKDFVASKNHVICSAHFTPQSYHFANSTTLKTTLKNDAVPSVFDFPDYENVTPERKPPRKRIFQTPDRQETTTPPIKVFKEPPSPTKEELKIQIDNLQRKVKTLQQKVRRSTVKVASLNDLTEELRNKNLVSTDVCNIIEQNFSGVAYDVVQNYFINKDRSSRGHRHSDSAKRFAMTLHFYSPRAYEYVRSIFALPDPRSIRYWTSSVVCEPGFFLDVFNRPHSCSFSRPGSSTFAGSTSLFDNWYNGVARCSISILKSTRHE